MEKEILVLTKYKKGYVVIGNAELIRATMISLGGYYNTQLLNRTVKGWVFSEYNVNKFLQLSSLINIKDLRHMTLEEIVGESNV